MERTGHAPMMPQFQKNAAPKRHCYNPAHEQTTPLRTACTRPCTSGTDHRSRCRPGAHAAYRRQFFAGAEPHPRLQGTSHRQRHGQVRPHRAQDRRDHVQHRHARLFRASGRGQPRRPRHDHRAGCGHRAVLFRRKRRTAHHRARHQAPGRAPDQPDRQSRNPAWRWRRTCISTAPWRRKPARWGWPPPPAPPPRSRWAMRWR